MLVALTCGVGPGVFVTGVSLLLLAGVVPPVSHTLRRQDPDEWVTLLVLLVSGVSISYLAGSLRAAKASSDLERQRLRTLLEVLPVPVTMVDRAGRFVENTPASKTIWGDSTSWVSELAEVPAYPAWQPDTGQPVARDELPLVRALTTGETTRNEELEFETLDGQHKILLNSATPICDASGTIRGAASVVQDITERKHLEAALRQAEREATTQARELEAIFEALTDGLLVYDAEGRILRHNTAARQLLGFEVHPEFASRSWQERAVRYAPLDSEGQPLASEGLALSRLLRGEVLAGTQTAEDCLHTPDGREVAFSMTGRPLRDAEGTVIGAVGIARDETERWRPEQQTREALHALLAMAEALVEAPLQGAAARAEEAPETNHVARRLAELTLRVLDCRYVGIVAVEPGTGKTTPITLVGVSPEHEQQWRASWDEHSRLGQHLRAFEVAALHAGEPILVTSVHTPFPRGRDLVPGSPSVLVPMRMGETLVGLLRVAGATTEEAYRRPHRQVLIGAVARLGALVLERERLLYEREEARANALAVRQTQAEMEAFLGIAGHELKNPLTSIKLALQLLERRLRRQTPDKTDETQDLTPFLQEVARAGHQAARLERLVNELLDVSRVRAGRLELHPEPTDLVAIVREAVDEQREIHAERTLLMESSPSRSVPVVADAERLGQVVTNYVTNALKYSPEERPVEVGLDVERQQARVWVRDHGLGIPLEEQERIWERFHRVPGIQVQSGTGVGLGLGLHICRTIVERHQGQVGVESTPGKGSTFWFTLPLGSQEEVQRHRPSRTLST